MVPFSFILLQTVCEGVCKSGVFLFVFVCLFLAKRLFYLLQQQKKNQKESQQPNHVNSQNCYVCA